MAERFTNPFPRFFTDSAALLSGGKLNFYVDDGGTTPKDTYSDSALTTANANPVILDASGVVPDIYLDGAYRITLENSDGVQQAESDNINSGSGDVTAWQTYDSAVDYASGPSVIVTASNGKYYKSIDTPNLNNEPSVSPAYWERLYLISDTDPALGGPLDGGDKTVKNINLLDYGEVTNAIGSTGGGTQDIDLTLGNVVSLTVDTSANTFTFSNPTDSDEMCGFTLWMTNGGSQPINWPASVDWPSGAAPTPTTAGLDKFVFETIDGGTIWTGDLINLDYS